MRAHRVVGDVAIAGELVRERAHVAGALHVVLAAQRVHADAAAADIAGRHGEVGDRHHRGRALAVLGDAEAVVDRAVAAGGVEPRRAADVGGRHAGDRLRSLRGLCCGSATNAAQSLELVASRSARATKASSTRPSVTMTCAMRVQHRDVGAGPQRQVIVAPRYAACAPGRCGADRSTISLAPSRSRCFMRRGEHRMAVGRVGADHQDHVGLLDASRNPACRPRCRRSVFRP